MPISDKKVYELIEFNERTQEKIRKLTDQNEQLRNNTNNSKIGGLDKDALKSLRVECKDLKSKLTKSTEFCRNIQDELLLYQKKFQKRKDTVESLQGEKSKLLKQIERLTTRNKELEKKVYNLESKLDNATTQIGYLKKELNKYKDSSIVLVEGTNESISEQCVDKAIDKSTIQLQTARIKKLEDELSQKNDELSSMRSINLESINIYREQVARLERELLKYTEKNDTLFKDLQKSEAKLIDLINKRDSILPTEISRALPKIAKDSYEPSDISGSITDFITLPIEGSGPDDDVVQVPNQLSPVSRSLPLLSNPEVPLLSDNPEVPRSNTILFIVGAIFLIIIIIYLIFSNKKPKTTYQPDTILSNNIPLNISNRVATKGRFRIHR